MSDFASAAQIGIPFPSAPAVLGTAASSAVSAGRSLLADTAAFPRLGLSAYFTVSVDGLGLGRWTACEGLKVEFKCDKIRSGGNYAHEYILPASITYSPITLKRGFEAAESRQVRRWLKEVALSWELWQGEGTLYPGTTVTVRLYSVYRLKEKSVAKWVLHDAYPVSWSGSALNANSNEVAVETLVFEHQGFELLEP